MITDEFMTVEEVAKTLRCSTRCVQALCSTGRIGSTKTGKRYLIPRESLDEYLKIRR